MPLVVMCGIPASGKTTRAQELERFLKEQCGKSTLLINEESLHINKKDTYKDNFSEKNTRATLKAAVERHLTREVVVIIDSLNYIKGYRYELYCIARSQRTPHCIVLHALSFLSLLFFKSKLQQSRRRAVLASFFSFLPSGDRCCHYFHPLPKQVYCNVPRETARQWNQNREDALNEALFEDLANRFEEPNDRNRWDNPLFVLTPEEPTCLEEVRAALFDRVSKAPNLATIPQKLSDTNFVYEMDKRTKEIVSAILQAQSESAVLGDNIVVPHTTQTVRLVRKLTMPELRRMRAQFQKITQLHPPKSLEEIGQLFVCYINTSLE
ncbi:kti12, chromatin associated [Balamuthia mandrillaris]